MFWPLITVLALLLAGGPSVRAATAADTSPKSSWQQVSPDSSPSYDLEAERSLLRFANEERQRAGLPALKMDEGLLRAARAHAVQMASQNQLSHQLSGEPSLTERISASSTLHLSRAGENVAVAATANDAHHALMASPPHRDNLLSANFNVAGIGVIRKGDRIYVAQDFAFSLPSYSVQQAQELLEESVEQLRSQAKMPRLERVSDRNSDACAMAKADSLRPTAAPPGAYVLRYTSMQPETLPSEISKVIAQKGLHTYSAGTCYARTERYPSGAYWVVLMFY